MLEGRGLNIVGTVMIVMALAGCGKSADSQAKAAKDAMSELQSASDAVGTVTDKASADAAGEKITTAAANLEAVARRIKQLPPATSEEATAIRADIAPQVQSIQSQMHASLDRLRDQKDLMSTLQGPMMRLEMSMMGVEGAIAFSGSSMQQKFPAGGPPAPMMARPGMAGGPSGTQAMMAAAQQRAAQARQNFASKFPAEKIVTIEITPSPTVAIRSKVYNHLSKLAGVESGFSQGNASGMTIELAPVDDPAALAAKVDFGKATVDAATRTIHVDANPAKLQTLPAAW